MPASSALPICVTQLTSHLITAFITPLTTHSRLYYILWPTVEGLLPLLSISILFSMTAKQQVSVGHSLAQAHKSLTSRPKASLTASSPFVFSAYNVIYLLQ